MRRSQRPFPHPDDSGYPDSAPSGPAPTLRGNLPAELNRFVGRDSELADLVRLLEGSRLVTVAGVGGVGKTRLATRAAALMEKRYCDGVWLVELSAVHDAALLEHALVDALGLTDHTNRPPRTTLLEHCADRHLLLVIDGFEHLVDACAELVRDLLRRAPRLRVLAAGRLPLELAGEATYSLATMTDEDALLLFAERAAAVRPDFRLTEHTRGPARELCRRLDGIPSRWNWRPAGCAPCRPNRCCSASTTASGC